MVYIHFPSNLTEEELMLQAKYQKLKKKKKALQALKAPKQEPEKPLISKRPADARDAREVARKLIKSGAIQAIQKPQLKQDQVSFKRPKGQERKRIVPESPTNVASYQPFSATQSTADSGGASTSAGPAAAAAAATALDNTGIGMEKEVSGRMQNLYQQLATERDREERGFVDKKVVAMEVPSSASARADKPRTGNTIYVSGNKVTEDYLKKYFSSFGTIVNVSMEIEKGRGFITFTKPECAEKAISDMHGKSVGGIQLQVQLARRQPQIEPINDASSSAVWSTLAASHSQKGSLKDKREMVHYDDIF